MDIQHLADITEGFTGVDIISFIATAVMLAIRETSQSMKIQS